MLGQKIIVCKSIHSKYKTIKRFIKPERNIVIMKKAQGLRNRVG